MLLASLWRKKKESKIKDDRIFFSIDFVRFSCLDGLAERQGQLAAQLEKLLSLVCVARVSPSRKDTNRQISSRRRPSRASRCERCCICTHDTFVFYSFPTVRKDLTLRLQFRFFNMNHRKPALIQWKVATPSLPRVVCARSTTCVRAAQSVSRIFFFPPPRGEKFNAIHICTFVQLQTNTALFSRATSTRFLIAFIYPRVKPFVEFSSRTKCGAVFAIRREVKAKKAKAKK